MPNQVDGKYIRSKIKLKKYFVVMFFSSVFWFSFSSYGVASESIPHQRHILSRLSFGVNSSQIQQIDQVGIEAYIQSQLQPQSVSESPILENYLAQLDSLDQQPIDLNKYEIALRKKLNNPQASSKQQKEVRLKIRHLNAKALHQTSDAHLARAVYSNRQLQEVMVDFWFSHFNVHAHKGVIRLWLNDYENQIRTHSLGNFYDLLIATAKHPAMLMYLDNRNNTAPESPAGKRSKLGLNENYAREVMELHTLGVEGGYSQDDVIALARIFTGWSMDARGKQGDKNGFVFYENRHDQQEKIFLGHKIAPNGIHEGEQALNILANHPATARFISYKLAQYFVADQPPESLVNHLTKQFLNSKGNIKLVMDALIHSQEFNDPQYYGQKFKTPYQYLTSLVRMGEIEQPDFKRIRGMLYQLSMPIYLCATPDGYKNTQLAWLNPQAMLHRTGFATAIANGALNKNSPVEIQRVKQNLGVISPRTKQVEEKTPPHLRVALMLGSPEAMYR